MLRDAEVCVGFKHTHSSRVRSSEWVLSTRATNSDWRAVDAEALVHAGVREGDDAGEVGLGDVLVGGDVGVEVRAAAAEAAAAADHDVGAVDAAALVHAGVREGDDAGEVGLGDVLVGGDVDVEVLAAPVAVHDLEQLVQRNLLRKSENERRMCE